MPRVFVIALVVLCSLPWTPAGSQGVSPPSRVIRFTMLESSEHTKFEKPVRELVRDTATFRRLWSGMQASDNMPTIDFRRSVGLFIAIGSRATNGYEVHVREIRTSGNELHVFLDLIEPGAECPVGAEVMAPATMVQALLRVPAGAPPKVVFHDRKFAPPCSAD